jgi:antitoxin MazE
LDLGDDPAGAVPRHAEGEHFSSESCWFSAKTESKQASTSKKAIKQAGKSKQSNIKNTVQLTVKDHSLIITPYEEVRSGWEDSFKLMTENEDDTLLDMDNIEHSWDEEEWIW